MRMHDATGISRPDPAQRGTVIGSSKGGGLSKAVYGKRWVGADAPRVIVQLRPELEPCLCRAAHRGRLGRRHKNAAARPARKLPSDRHGTAGGNEMSLRVLTGSAHARPLLGLA